MAGPRLKQPAAKGGYPVSSSAANSDDHVQSPFGSQAVPIQKVAKRRWMTLVRVQILYLLSLCPWLLFSFFFAFACDIPSSSLCQKAEQVEMAIISYPISLLWCVLAWIIYVLHRCRLAFWVNLLPIGHALAYVAAWAYVS